MLVQIFVSLKAYDADFVILVQFRHNKLHFSLFFAELIDGVCHVIDGLAYNVKFVCLMHFVRDLYNNLTISLSYIPSCFCIYNNRQSVNYFLQIHSNGYITMGQPYNRRMPADFTTVASNKKRSSARNGFAMFAPLWADANFKAGRVTYRVYDRTDSRLSATEKLRMKHILQLAKEDTALYGGSSAIDPSWVMVVTWEDATPRMFYRPRVETVRLLFTFTA